MKKTLKHCEFFCRGMRALNQTHWYRILFLFLCMIVLPGQITGAAYVEDTIHEHIKDAETYYWFGMAEKGNMEAFRRGLGYLRKAESLLASSSLPKETSDALRREIQSLEVDFAQQAEVHVDTLYGVFPLVRLLAPSLFADALATGTFELVDDPAVMASTAAASGLATKVLQKWSSRPQLNVVFTSVPMNKALENESLYIFNSSPRFFVHNFREIVKALLPDQVNQFQKAEITEEITKKLCKTFDITEFLAITVREIDVTDKGHFYLIEGDVYNINEDAPTHSFSSMGFSRDRRGQLWPIILCNIALFILSLLIYPLLIYLRSSEWPTFPAFILVPVAAFLVGRVVPWILVPMYATISPVPETLAKVSFWWPCGAGAVLFLGPALVYRIASGQIRSFGPMFDMEGKGGALFLTIAMGVCAYLAVPLFLFSESNAVLLLAPVVLSGGIAMYVLGRTIDKIDHLPLYAALFPVIIVFALGAATCHLSPGYLWLCFAVIVIPSLFFLIRVSLRKQGNTGTETIESDKTAIPLDIHELINRTEKPDFRRLKKTHDEVFLRADPFVEGTTVWLDLTGPAGCGKTATANAVIAEAIKKLKKEGRDTALLQGECPERISGDKGESNAYAPFKMALAQYFDINILAPPEKQLKQIDIALKGIFESAIPFSGLLFPQSEKAPNPASSRREVSLSIVRAILKLAEKKAVVLFIDDVHWIDGASLDLLNCILEHLPEKKPPQFLVLLTSRNEKLLSDTMKRPSYRLKPLEPNQRTDILVSSLGLMREVAQTVVEKSGEGTVDKGGLFWLFRVVSYLAEKGLFKRTDDGFSWSLEYKGADNLPVPSDFQEAIEEQFDSAPEYRSVIECAACLGAKFRASILAESLGMEKLALLQILSRIEDETGILFDVSETDDLYSFQSPFMLEILRKKIRISGKGPKDKGVPQLIREYHARVASSLKKNLDRSTTTLYEVAMHYYAGGLSCAADGLEYCLKAAHAARSEFLYSQARNFIDMAKECAEVLGRNDGMEEEQFLIDLDRAHVEQKEQVEAADKGLAYLNASEKVPIGIMVAVTRACYDAGGAAPTKEEGQVYFAEAVRLGRSIVERADQPVDQAEGYHFIGISLPIRDAEKREENLRKALELLEPFSEKDLAAQALCGRVANSLAEQMSYGPSKNPVEAKKLFDLSREIKGRPDLRDIPGLARTHGGLGRLAFAAGDIPVAREHFLKDLNYSERVGDIGGQAKMYSSLGACDIEDEDFEGALKHYIESRQLAESAIDKLFAVTGKLRAALPVGDMETFGFAGNELLALAKEAGFVPRDCAGKILEVLEQHGDHTSTPWGDDLMAASRKAVGK